MNYKIKYSVPMRSKVLMDSGAFREYQSHVINGSDEIRRKIQSFVIILPAPAFNFARFGDPIIWSDKIKREYGLTVNVETVPLNMLPSVGVSLRRSGLSKRNYRIVKYAMYFANIIPDLRVDCVAPGVMELYEDEIFKL